MGLGILLFKSAYMPSTCSNLHRLGYRWLLILNLTKYKEGTVECKGNSGRAWQLPWNPHAQAVTVHAAPTQDTRGCSGIYTTTLTSCSLRKSWPDPWF